MLIPFFFLIGSYGTGDRVAATLKMIVYTLVGSLLMLVGAIATAILAAEQTGELTFSIAELRANVLPEGSQDWIFCFFAAAFLVKMPAFPIHGWMPDAYRAAPLPVLALLSGVLSKVAAYGFLRVVLPIFPDATIQFQELILVIALASILYGSAMAFTQTNVRLIAGYSSIAQLGFITLGVFALTGDSGDGAVLQMVNHGLVVVPVFLVIALLAERAGTEDLREMGGLAMRAPVLTGAIPDPHAGDAGHAGLGQLRRRVLHPQRALRRQDRLRRRRDGRGRLGGVLRAADLPAHDAQPPAGRARIARDLARRRAVIAPLVAVIVALALYPGLILERGEASVEDQLGAVGAAGCETYATETVGEPSVAGIECPNELASRVE